MELARVALDGLQRDVALGLRQRVVAHDVGPAEDRVHWIAQLVRDHRQSLVLALVRRLRGARRARRSLGLATLAGDRGRACESRPLPLRRGAPWNKVKRARQRRLTASLEHQVDLVVLALLHTPDAGEPPTEPHTVGRGRGQARSVVRSPAIATTARGRSTASLASRRSRQPRQSRGIHCARQVQVPSWSQREPTPSAFTYNIYVIAAAPAPSPSGLPGLLPSLLVPARPGACARRAYASRRHPPFQRTSHADTRSGGRWCASSFKRCSFIALDSSPTTEIVPARGNATVDRATKLRFVVAAKIRAATTSLHLRAELKAENRTLGTPHSAAPVSGEPLANAARAALGTGDSAPAGPLRPEPAGVVRRRAAGLQPRSRRSSPRRRPAGPRRGHPGSDAWRVRRKRDAERDRGGDEHEAADVGDAELPAVEVVLSERPIELPRVRLELGHSGRELAFGSVR